MGNVASRNIEPWPKPFFPPLGVPAYVLVDSQLLLFHDEVRESHYLVSSWMTVVCMGLNGSLLVQNMANRTTKHWPKNIKTIRTSHPGK
jgi:hypothetical protein